MSCKVKVTSPCWMVKSMKEDDLSVAEQPMTAWVGVRFAWTMPLFRSTAIVDILPSASRPARGG